MRENSKDLAYGLIGTLKYEGILHLISLRKVSETEDQSNGKARERGDRREGLVW